MQDFTLDEDNNEAFAGSCFANIPNTTRIVMKARIDKMTIALLLLGDCCRLRNVLPTGILLDGVGAILVVVGRISSGERRNRLLLSIPNSWLPLNLSQPSISDFCDQLKTALAALHDTTLHCEYNAQL